MKRLSWVVPLSILLIFVLLFNAFKSLRSALLIVANIPLALIGGILALAATGIPCRCRRPSASSPVRAAVLNGVVMVTCYDQLRQNEGLGVAEAVVRGSMERLRTVLMTALLAMLGLLPWRCPTRSVRRRSAPWPWW